MKKIISLLGLATMMLCFSFAKANPIKEFNTKKIISIYVEATNLGNSIYNAHLFADDFEYRDSNNNKTDKKTYLKFLKQNENYIFNCDTAYEILDEYGKSCVAKVTMKFENFIRVEYVTLSKTEEGWKISKVITTYP